MKRVAIATVFLTALAASRPVAAAWPWSDDAPRMSASLCRLPETALFACKVGTKIVSICGQPQGGAVYRFGRPGRIELEVADLHYVEHGFSGGGETQVYADTKTHRYVVYDQIARTAFGPDGHHDPQAKSGLLVQSGGVIVSSRTCTEPMTFSPLADTLIPGGDYVPH